MMRNAFTVLGVSGLLIGTNKQGLGQGCPTDSEVTISSASEAVELASCPGFEGHVLINASTVTEPTEFDINGPTELTYLSIFASHRAGGKITVRSSSLRNVSTSLKRSRQPVAQTTPPEAIKLELPSLDYATRLIVSGPFESLETEFAANFTTGEYEVSYANLQEVSIDFARARWVGIEHTEAITVSGSIEEVGRGGLVVFDNPILETISLPDLTSIQAWISIRANARLQLVEAQELETSGVFFVEGNGRGLWLKFPKLKRIDRVHLSQDSLIRGLRLVDLGSLEVINCTVFDVEQNTFESLSLPRLTQVHGTLNISDNLSLETLDMPRLTETEEFVIANSPALSNVTLNILAKAGSIHMTGNFTNVELFSLEEVAGDFYLQGQDEMDCSWFDDHFSQKIVRGDYYCGGNHTKPAVERTPSTPTDISQLDGGDSDSAGSDGSPEGAINGGDGAGGLSTGAKAGIGVGVGAVGIIALGIGAWLFARRRRERGTSPAELPGDEKAGTVLGADGQTFLKKNEVRRLSELPNSERASELPDSQRASELPSGEYFVNDGICESSGYETRQQRAELAG